MANAARGEVDVEIGGQRVTLALNLGALAELEDAFGTTSFEAALAQVVGETVSAKNLRTFMVALCRGNGVKADVDKLDFSDALDLLILLFKRSGIVPDKEPAKEGGESPLAARKGGKPGRGSA